LNEIILNTKVQSFINKHLDSNVTSLIFKGSPFLEIETKVLVEQIEAKKRCQKKLPTWFNTENIYFPNKLNIEQTSSETTASYKAQLIHGESLIDLTGGFGVDCYYFSKTFKHVKHCELNESLSKLVAHNFVQLKTNIETIHIDGIDYLKSSKEHFSWVYIDPSRRHDSKGKVFFLKDCLPNVPQHLDLLFEASHNIMIKTSPLLDFSVGLKELKHVKTIHVVAVNNEVKELLWVLEKGYNEETEVKTVNLKPQINEVFNFLLKEEPNAIVDYQLPLSYLYEPNAALLKSGAFNTIACKLNIGKLHKHSHLYTSDKLIDFPGRRFRIQQILAYSKKLLKKESFTKANITVRNFPETVEQLRKRYHIKDGGDIYLFFTMDYSDSKIVLVCAKIS